MPMLLYDLSPKIDENLAVFPGDTAFSQELLLSFEKGHNLRLSSFKTTTHLGAHTDAPNHYHPQGIGIDQVELSRYLGPAQVFRISTRMGGVVEIEDIKNFPIQSRRILFCTLSFPNPSKWNENFMGISAKVVDYLAKAGVQLIGIDTPSIDPANSKSLEAHQAVYKNKMSILEGIVLDKIPNDPSQLYQLIALPLAIKGADASPVRAILIEGGITNEFEFKK